MDVGVMASRIAAPIPAPGGGGGGGTEMLHSDAPAMSSMSANTKGRIAVTSNVRLALSAAVPGQGQGHRMRHDGRKHLGEDG